MKNNYTLLTVEGLIEELQKVKDKDATVILSAYNNHVSTYAVADHIWEAKYDIISNDFFGTPGRMDKRLFDKNIKNFCYIGSMFGEIPMKDIDFGDDNTNICIELLNGEDGDPNLLWEQNNFIFDKDRNTWVFNPTEYDLKNNTHLLNFSIEYTCETKYLKVIANKEPNISYKFEGYCYGIDDLADAIKSCHINKCFFL
jgi:hypothetical protein